jgi:hypothetical protein
VLVVAGARASAGLQREINTAYEVSITLYDDKARFGLLQLAHTELGFRDADAVLPWSDRGNDIEPVSCAGGAAYDVIFSVHELNRHVAELAARTLVLNVHGAIDFSREDYRKFQRHGLARTRDDAHTRRVR